MRDSSLILINPACRSVNLFESELPYLNQYIAPSLRSGKAMFLLFLKEDFVYTESSPYPQHL